jgi:hypothetical protein
VHKENNTTALARKKQKTDESNRVRTSVRAAFTLVGLLLTTPNARAQKPVEFERVSARPLRISQPGVAVIRDSDQWTTLWQRWEQVGYSSVDGAVVHAAVPQFDFRREMAIAVSLGSSSGCDNTQNNIGRVIEWPDSIVVTAPPGLLQPRVTCAMIIEPVDVVRVPRSNKRVVFRVEEGGAVLVAAPWWWRPSASEFEAADPAKQAAFVLALTRDLATPPSTIEAIVRYSTTPSGLIGQVLLNRRDVRSSIPLLTLLTRNRVSEDSAITILFRDFGTTVAGDQTTSRDVLTRFVQRLSPPSAQGHDVAARMLKNPTVVADSGLMVDMTKTLPDRDLRAEACRLYLARWRAWKRATNPDHSFPGWDPIVSCPNMPHPSTTRR